MTVNDAKFEDRRLALFRRYEPRTCGRRIEDLEHRTTYLLEVERGGTGTPLLCLHGGGADASVWAPFIPMLASSHIVVADRPGCGLSDRETYQGVDVFDSAAHWLRGILDGLSIERVDLLGCSMGGLFATAFAAREPARVRRLVFIGAPAGIERWIPPTLRAMVVGASNVVGGDPRDHIVPGAIAVVAHPERMDPEFLAVRQLAAQIPGVDDSFRSLLRELIDGRGFIDRYLLANDLRRLTVRTRFVWGERDAFTPPEVGEQLAREMASADVVRVPDAGHHPWHDAKDTCAAAVNDVVEGQT